MLFNPAKLLRLAINCWDTLYILFVWSFLQPFQGTFWQILINKPVNGKSESITSITLILATGTGSRYSFVFDIKAGGMEGEKNKNGEITVTVKLG